MGRGSAGTAAPCCSTGPAAEKTQEIVAIAGASTSPRPAPGGPQRCVRRWLAGLATAGMQPGSRAARFAASQEGRGTLEGDDQLLLRPPGVQAAHLRHLHA